MYVLWIKHGTNKKGEKMSAIPETRMKLELEEKALMQDNVGFEIKIKANIARIYDLRQMLLKINELEVKR